MNQLFASFYWGEWMEKVAEVPPVHRQFIGENRNARQKYGKSRSQIWVSQVAKLHSSNL
jgi:hypothetical protein